jgi:hypothetical protein
MRIYEEMKKEKNQFKHGRIKCIRLTKGREKMETYRKERIGKRN